MEILSSSRIKGYLSLVLHAHLPFVRNPEHEYFLEERWLYEAITETYIPLLHLFEKLLNEGVDFRVTISVTPTLVEMFNDDLMRNRYQRHIESLVELAEKETKRLRKDAEFGPVARMYHKRLLRTRHLFQNVYRRDLASAFRSLLHSGKVEIITCAATHAYLPALLNDPASVRAQILTGAAEFKRNFGRKPSGMWLPECGFAPGIDIFLKQCGIKFFFLESHGLLNSIPKNNRGIYAPIRTPAGVYAFSRDAACSRQVWSASEGYPGDFDYRDFYSDIGFERDFSYLKPHLAEGIRTFTGLKYHRITGKSDDKKPYIRHNALKKAGMHADHFLRSRKDQISLLNEKLNTRPVVTAAYDAELFGHWWFEGPEWLGCFLRKASRQNTFRLVTPSEYLAENSGIETATPSMSSWGDRGYSSTWVSSSNSWIYRPLGRAARMMKDAATRHPHARGLTGKALNQAARELLLAQASDWAFMMKTGSASEFAENRFAEHIRNFFDLHREITEGKINRSKLLRLELTNNIFDDIDYRMYGE